MRTRVLEPEEFDRLEVTGMPEIPDVRPEDMTHVVVEDDAGDVVGALTVLRVTHWEGAWIHPKHRNAGVVRGLLEMAEAVSECRGSRFVFAGAADERMRDILTRLGGSRVAMDTYALKLGGEPCRQQ